MASKKTQTTDSFELIPFNFRMPRALLDALDERVEELNRSDPYQRMNRSDLIRELLARGLRDPPSRHEK